MKRTHLCHAQRICQSNEYSEWCNAIQCCDMHKKKSHLPNRHRTMERLQSTTLHTHTHTRIHANTHTHLAQHTYTVFCALSRGCRLFVLLFPSLVVLGWQWRWWWCAWVAHSHVIVWDWFGGTHFPAWIVSPKSDSNFCSHLIHSKKTSGFFCLSAMCCGSTLVCVYVCVWMCRLWTKLMATFKRIDFHLMQTRYEQVNDCYDYCSEDCRQGIVHNTICLLPSLFQFIFVVVFFRLVFRNNFSARKHFQWHFHLLFQPTWVFS